MAGNKDMDKRKKIRVLEAKRDALLMRMNKDRVSISEVRAALKQTRK